ncbi:MAG: hypothetical protein J6M34_01485 [Clostridia bacterium]|nr:hypothetical protein [Clostridia bacterium]
MTEAKICFGEYFMIFVRDVENNSVSVRVRKAYTEANLSSHSILTDDVFSYVDFFFKTHPRRRRKSDNRDYAFYWKQAQDFYKATKALPIESSPLPMYYCMLNAIKAYIVYASSDTEAICKKITNHGLREGSTDECGAMTLSSIRIQRLNYGVFHEFCRLLNCETIKNWPIKNEGGSVSAKELMYQLPFVHSAYASTYKIPRKKEKFIPLQAGKAPTFRYEKNRKIRLVVDLDPHYFKGDTIALPKEVVQSLPKGLIVNPENCFQVVSERQFKKTEINPAYNEYRKYFSYIAADKRLWYLNREIGDEGIPETVNTMIPSVALAHRFSEIVRYKPEQMVRLLRGRENWLIHEFLSNVLDQFMDEISCEITKEEIMPTKQK